MIHLREIFLILTEQKLYANLKKCDFFSPSVIFLGYIISKDGIRMEPSKVEAILNWFKRQSRHYVWDEPYLWKYCAYQVIRRCVPQVE